MGERVNRSLCIGLASLALLFGCAAPTVQERLRVQIPAAIDPDAQVDESVRRVCDVEMTVAVQVFNRVKARVPRAVQVRSLRGGADPALRLTIVVLGVLPRRDPSWSSDPRISVRADLLQDSKVIASKLFERSTPDYLPIPQSACNLVERTAANLGKEIATWAVESLEGRAAPSP